MRNFLTICVAVYTMLIHPNGHAEEFQADGQYFISSHKDEMSDEESVKVFVFAEKYSPYRGEPAMFGIGCDDKTVTMLFSPSGTYISDEKSPWVEYRFDKRKSDEFKWDLGSSSILSAGDNALKFIQMMYDANPSQTILRVIGNFDTHTATFNTSGIRSQIHRVVDKCEKNIIGRQGD